MVLQEKTKRIIRTCSKSELDWNRSEKITAVTKWEALTLVRQVYSFFGFSIIIEILLKI